MNTVIQEVTILLDNAPERWVGAFFVAIAVWFGLQYLRKFLVSQLEVPAASNSTVSFIRDLLIKTRALFILIVALYCGFNVLTLTPKLAFILNKTLIVTAILQIGIWCHRLLSFALEQSGVRQHVDSMVAKGAMNTLNTILRVILWSIIALLLLGNLGFEIGPLVAGLGIGGIAIALGIQSTLQDIAASLSILFDKPFMVGDFIIIGDFLGTVERIGIKTTRLLSLSGEQIVFSNSDLLNSRIRNYKKMQERRIVFTFRIPYDTAYDKVKSVPGMVEKIIRGQELLRFDRAHLSKFTEYAFEYEVVYYVLSPSYNIYMDMQQLINYQIIEYFEAQGLAFAFPKHRVILDKKTV